MKYTLSLFVAMLLPCSALFASEGEAQKAPDVGRKESSSQKASPRRSISGPLREVLVRDVTIASKASEKFDSDTDFSGAERIAIAVIGDDTSLKGLRIAVLWADYEQWFTVTDMLRCDTFFYSDHGGLLAPVYGPFLRIVLMNDGATAVKIKQLSVYAVRQ